MGREKTDTLIPVGYTNMEKTRRVEKKTRKAANEAGRRKKTVLETRQRKYFKKVTRYIQYHLKVAYNKNLKIGHQVGSAKVSNNLNISCFNPIERQEP